MSYENIVWCRCPALVPERLLTKQSTSLAHLQDIFPRPPSLATSQMRLSATLPPLPRPLADMPLSHKTPLSPLNVKTSSHSDPLLDFDSDFRTAYNVQPPLPLSPPSTTITNTRSTSSKRVLSYTALAPALPSSPVPCHHSDTERRIGPSIHPGPTPTREMGVSAEANRWVGLQHRAGEVRIDARHHLTMQRELFSKHPSSSYLPRAEMLWCGRH